MDKAKQTANLIDELLTSHPTAIRLNAIRLGLARDGENVSRSSLMTAMVDKKKADNLSDKQAAKLMFDLLSTENATRNLMYELASENTEGGQKQEIHELPSWVFYVVVFVFILGIGTTIVVLGRTINKILN